MLMFKLIFFYFNEGYNGLYFHAKIISKGINAALLVNWIIQYPNIKRLCGESHHCKPWTTFPTAPHPPTSRPGPTVSHTSLIMGRKILYAHAQHQRMKRGVIGAVKLVWQLYSYNDGNKRDKLFLVDAVNIPKEDIVSWLQPNWQLLTICPDWAGSAVTRCSSAHGKWGENSKK